MLLPKNRCTLSSVYLSGCVVQGLLRLAELRADKLLLSQLLLGLQKIFTRLLQPENNNNYHVKNKENIYCAIIHNLAGSVTSAASHPGRRCTAPALFYCQQTAHSPADRNTINTLRTSLNIFTGVKMLLIQVSSTFLISSSMTAIRSLYSTECST